MRSIARRFFGLSLLFVFAHAANGSGATPVGPGMHVAFEFSPEIIAELDLVQKDDVLSFIGAAYQGDKVLVDSFRIDMSWDEIVQINADNQFRIRSNTYVSVKSLQTRNEVDFFMTNDARDTSFVSWNPARVGEFVQVEVGAQVFRRLQASFEQNGGEGNVAVAIAAAFRDFYLIDSGQSARGEPCSPTFTECRQAARCDCGASTVCCGVVSAGHYCCIASFTYAGSTCFCDYACTGECDDSKDPKLP